MFRACELKDQTYKKTRTLQFAELRHCFQQEASIRQCDLFLLKFGPKKPNLSHHMTSLSLQNKHIWNHVMWWFLAKFAGVLKRPSYVSFGRAPTIKGQSWWSKPFPAHVDLPPSFSLCSPWRRSKCAETGLDYWICLRSPLKMCWK